ncbi:MAG: phosphomannomutase/phosphoglucomutase [Candidatus Aenigmatarchaeota archaeon]
MYDKVFRAYDIRGIYPNEINEDFAYKLGIAISKFLKQKNKKVVVGNDVRLSSESLKNSLIKALNESGVKVIDIGLVPTPLVSIATKMLKANLGISVTASHNPKEWNGFILNDSKGIAIGLGFGLEKIRDLMKEEANIKSKKEGITEKINFEEKYLEFIRKKFNFQSNLKVIIDAGNGNASEILPKILKEYNKGINIELFCRFDGNFPNRDPEPKKENLSKLIEKVLIEKADIGFAYDGDADRIAVIDERGNVLSSHQILSLLMQSYGSKMKNKKVVIEVLSSLAAMEEIKKYKAKPIISKVGRTYIQNEMYKNKALLAAEISYHFYFKEAFYQDDTIFATLKILELLSKTNKKVSELIKDVPNYFYESKRVEISDEKKFMFVESLEKDFKDYKIEKIDGIKVWLDAESWICIRASNTEPKISIAYESKNQKRFEELKEIANRIIEKARIF